MKKIIIMISIFFIATAFTKAQEAQNDEQIKENVQTEADQKVEAVKEEAVQTVTEKKAENQTQTKGSKEQYLADLNGNDESKIINAAEWLGEKEEKTAIPRLVDLLKNDKRAKVRVYATVALGTIGDESSIPALNEALTGDANADVRYAVLLAIHRINPAKSLDALKKAKETESDPYIKDYIEKMEEKWKEKK